MHSSVLQWQRLYTVFYCEPSSSQLTDVEGTNMTAEGARRSHIDVPF